MSDQYQPSSEGPSHYVGLTATDVSQPIVQRQTGSGFGAGILVATVFIVVALLAATIFSNRHIFAPAGSVETPQDAAMSAPAEARAANP